MTREILSSGPPDRFFRVLSRSGNSKLLNLVKYRAFVFSYSVLFCIVHLWFSMAGGKFLAPSVPPRSFVGIRLMSFPFSFSSNDNRATLS